MSKNLIDILFKQENPENQNAETGKKSSDSRENAETGVQKEGSPNLDRDAYEYFIKTF